MKTVILAGGLGTRISEESDLKPKPMVEIGGMPILWHILKIYSHYGFNDFIICCGYKGYVIKEYFANYYLHHSDITFNFTKKNESFVHKDVVEPWKITMVDTGLDTMTGGRIKRIKEHVGKETFLMTYGDGVCDVDLNKVVNYHKKSKAAATLTAVQPGWKFGMLEISKSGLVERFKEKEKKDGGWINGGFMVLEPGIFDMIEDDNTVFELGPLGRCAKNGKLRAYKHNGFWQCMDTLRDKLYLEGLIAKGEAPWIKWES